MKYFSMIIFLVTSSMATAQLMDKIKTRSGGDPAIPTDLFTRYDSHFEASFDAETYLVGNIWSIAFAFNNKYQVNANAPLAYSGKSNKFGLGDAELGFVSIPLLDSAAFLTALGYKLQVSIPTGSFNNNLGIGAFRVAPAIIANFKFSEKFYLLPEFIYFFTSKVLQSVPDLPSNSDQHGLDASIKMVYKPTDNSWIWLTPSLNTFDLADSNTDFELEVLYGVKLLNRVGLTAYIRNNFDNNTFIFQFTNSIFF